MRSRACLHTHETTLLIAGQLPHFENLSGSEKRFVLLLVNYNIDMSTPAELKSPDELRPLLHGKIDKLGSEGLQIMHRVLLRLEVEELAAKVGERFSSRPDLMERIDKTIAEVRSENPYR